MNGRHALQRVSQPEHLIHIALYGIGIALHQAQALHVRPGAVGNESKQQNVCCMRGIQTWQQTQCHACALLDRNNMV